LAQFWQILISEDIEGARRAPGNVGTEADMSGYRFPAYVVRDSEGWTAHCPEFPDCRARGATYELALENLRDVIQIFVEDGLGDDEQTPRAEDVALTTLTL